MSRNQGEVWRGELQQAFAPIGKVVIQILTLDQLQGAGYGLSFYVGWGQSNSALYTQVSHTVRDFRGHLNWLVGPEFNDRGAFISVWPLEQGKNAWSGDQVKRSSPEELNNELIQFCRFMRNNLRIPEHLSANEAELKWSAEPFENSIYRVLLIANPTAFQEAPTSASDRALHFGITEDEWLSVSHMASESQRARGSSKESSFLSELSQRYEVVRVLPEDTKVLGQQLADTQQRTSDPNLRGALANLRRIFNEAEKNRLGVVFKPVE